MRIELMVVALAVAAGCVSKTPRPSPREDDALPTTRDGQPASLEQALAMLDERSAWDERGPVLPARHPNEALLKGWVIVLDPGHGGDAHLPDYKRGPTGVREAEINFRVAVLLKRLLDDAGARVILTRTGDYDLGLDERAAIANTAPRPDGGTGADLFLSIHHNAAGPDANYTSVWFHGPVDDAEVELDVARYLAFNLTRALRTKVPKTQPIMNDRQMYPGGFGVLRHAKVPAILTEASFHSHPPEEQRLRDAIYNLREAYAMYWALCEYARGGRPSIRNPRIDGATLTVELDDGLFGGWGADLGRILPSTIDVRVNGQSRRHEFDEKSRRLSATIPADPEGAVVEIRFANLFKQHNYPQHFRVERAAEGLTLAPASRPRQPMPATGPVHPVAPVGTTRPSASAR